MLLVAAVTPTGAGVEAPTTILSIVGTTDLHGYIAPREGVGGLALLGGYLRNLRAARAADGGGVLLVDAGDTYLGGLESNMSEGAVVVDAYNALGYAAAAIGNHDLEFGSGDSWGGAPPDGDDPRGALKARARQARYPLLAANLIDGATGAPVAWPNVRPSTMVEVAGVRVGLTGVMTLDALSMTLAANVQGLSTAPLAPAVEREARTLRAQGADLVVLVAHAGGSCAAFDAPDDLNSCDDSAEIFEVVRALPRGLLDGVVAGHTHDGVAHRVAGVPIVQAYSWGRAFSRVDLTIDRATKTVTGARVHAPQDLCLWRDGATGRCAPGPGATALGAQYEGRAVAVDPAIEAAMAPALARVRSWRTRPLGATLQAPIARGPGDAESPLGNLFADAMRAAVPGAEAALSYGAGPGGLRAELPAGPLTVGAVFDLFPYDNRVEVVTLTGADLRRLLGDHVRRPFWRRALGVSGLQVRHTCAAGGDRVEVTRTSGLPVADDDRLTIAMTDFLANRVRRLQAAPAPPPTPSAPLIREVVAGWLASHGTRLGPTALADPDAPRWVRLASPDAPCAAP